MSAGQVREVEKGKYRPEIDGLRAFAVVAVIINHFNKNILPGGYLGVDIFFVISGYVITSSLYGRPSKDFKDFISGFYERRIKRLVPALSVFVMITSIAICLFNPLTEISLRTGFASLFGLSNLYLLLQSTDYFAQSTELNVFTHTWSLGVEEQFYILFPFLIWFSGFGRQTKNGARHLFFTVGVLAIASFIGFIYLYPLNQSAAYFLMPSRFWEMAVGCLIFIGGRKRASIGQLLEKIPPLLVLVLIVGVMYLPTSWAAASTVAVGALTSILLASLKRQTAAFRILTNAKVVYIGLISYSLYLWHWGVLSISRWTIGIHWWSVPFQVALMLGIAVASYRWIEIPLRTGNWFGRRWRTLLVGGGVLVMVSGLVVTLARPLEHHLFLGKIARPKSPPYLNGGQCLEKISQNTDCYFIYNRGSRTLWVIGDSHASVLSMAAEEVAKTNTMHLRLYTAGGTPFPPVGHYKKSNKLQDLQSLEDFKLIEKKLHKQLAAGDVILLSMRLPYHFGGTYYEYPPSDFMFPRQDGSHGSQNDYFADWLSSVSNLATVAQARGASVIIQTPTPEWERENTLQCSIANKQWFNLLQERNCQIDSKFFKDQKTGLYKHLFQKITKESKSHQNIYLLDTFSIVCPGRVCIFHDNSIDFYFDANHLSSQWAKDKVAPELLRLVQATTKQL